jgi:DNA-nicking Smr family endonuclease
VRPGAAAAILPAKAPRARPGETLDGGWDRRLRRGAVAPDAMIDLHGYSLARAHAALEAALAAAIARGDRLLLVVTGRPPRADDPHGRGAIRSAMPDWIAGSRHVAGIAAVRGAHPRHGGAGALYLVLRRAK